MVGCLTSQQHARVSQGRICSDKFTCCHVETEVAETTFCLTQSPYTDTRATSPSADPTTQGAWQGSHWSANFQVTGMTQPGKIPTPHEKSNPGSSAPEVEALITKPTRRFEICVTFHLVRIVLQYVVMQPSSCCLSCNCCLVFRNVSFRSVGHGL